MRQPLVKAVVAMNNTRAIGAGNALLWHIPADLQHFKAQTQGRALIMGYNTYKSIGKALPNRTTIVLSRDTTLRLDDALVCYSVEQARHVAYEAALFHGPIPEIIIAGGADIYALFMPFVRKLIVTKVDNEWEGDTYFPDTPEFRKKHYRDRRRVNGKDRNGTLQLFDISFQEWVRKADDEALDLI